MRLRLNLQPTERQDLERLTRERWESWRLSETTHGDIGQGFRADILTVETEHASTHISCLAVELPNHGEIFRLKVDSQILDSARGVARPPGSPPTAQIVQALDVGRTPQLFLIWHTYEYPDESLASIQGLLVTCADALLVKGSARQFLVQASRVPSWLTLTVDEQSIKTALEAAHEIELLA